MRITRSVGAKVAGAIAAATAGIAFSMTPAAFAATQGTATLVGAGNVTLTSGNLTTPFSVGLSAPGVCSGTSSTSPQYFVYSFIIPPPASGTTLSQELAGITWSTGVPGQYYPLEYNAANDRYGPANTSTTGQPMPAPNPFQFGYTDSQVKSAGLTALESNTWEVGYACETGDHTVDYWATQVTFDANGNWTASSAVAAPEVPLAVIVPVTGVGIAGAGLVLARRRNRRQVSAA